MRAEHDAGCGGEERIPHVACGMVRRHVQVFEVQFVGLDLTSTVNLEAQVGEDRVDLSQDLRCGVQPAAGPRTTRQGHIERIGGQACLKRLFFRLGKPFLVLLA